MKWVKYIIIALAMPLFGALMAQNQAEPQGQSDSAQGSATAAKSEANNKPNPWLNPDFKSYVKAIDDLVKIGDEYAKNKLNLALSNYQTGKSLIEKMRESIERYREESEETLRLNEKWYWQTMDRKNKEEKIINEDKREAKLKAITYFTRAVHHLDEIENPKVTESEEYKSLLSNIYRDWAMAQYDIGNIPQIIDVLNRYIALDRKYEEIAEPHKYLASAYAFQEKMLDKYGKGSTQDLIYFKRMKNKHLLRATELMYGKDTPEYNRIMEIVNQDETIAIAP